MFVFSFLHLLLFLSLVLIAYFLGKIDGAIAGRFGLFRELLEKGAIAQREGVEDRIDLIPHPDAKL